MSLDFPIHIFAGHPEPLGLSVTDGVLNIAVLAPGASSVDFCLFDELEVPVLRRRLPQCTDGVWHGAMPYASFSKLASVNPQKLLYGFRADGEYMPENSVFYDPSKLLLDPYAKQISRPFQPHPDLWAPRADAIDTVALVPKAIFNPDAGAGRPEFDPPQSPPKLIYEISVKALTQLHPDIPADIRGTIAALKEPCVLEHLKQIGVDAVELMPIAAWMDEPHLSGLGLSNAWGYNPVGMMALDPRLCPGGPDELRETVRVLKENGIRVILDVVFNHTAEADGKGSTLSLRGLDNRYYYRHYSDMVTHQLMMSNDSGCGNTLDCAQEGVIRLCMDTLRYWVLNFGISGFRFDLAPVLGRYSMGFRKDAELLKTMEKSPVLSKIWLIAEPWDIGLGGYQLGNFDEPWYEWNDRYRDTVRRFWRGDANILGDFATRLAGSSDVFFHSDTKTRSVNFIAAHDGMTLHDLTAYVDKHNEANGEDNRDGHNGNYSWNYGVEGDVGGADGVELVDDVIVQKRRRDVAAMLATLMVSRGTPMLTAGDEFGRTQKGNNNAYAQNNEISWLNWAHQDTELSSFFAGLARLRARIPALHELTWLNGNHFEQYGYHDVCWWSEAGQIMNDVDWYDIQRHSVGLKLFSETPTLEAGTTGRIFIWFNAEQEPMDIVFPAPKEGCAWQLRADSSTFSVHFEPQAVASEKATVAPRSVTIWLECMQPS